MSVSNPSFSVSYTGTCSGSNAGKRPQLNMKRLFVERPLHLTLPPTWFYSRKTLTEMPLSSKSENATTDSVIAIMGGYKKLCQIPSLPWKEKLLGPTKAIDRICLSDFPKQGPYVVVGQDPDVRGFIAFCITAVWKGQAPSADSKSFTGVQTFYQYRSGRDNQWNSAAWLYSSEGKLLPELRPFRFPFCPIGIIKNSDLGHVQKLLKGESVTIEIKSLSWYFSTEEVTVQLTSSLSQSEENG